MSEEKYIEDMNTAHIIQVDAPRGTLDREEVIKKYANYTELSKLKELEQELNESYETVKSIRDEFYSFSQRLERDESVLIGAKRYLGLAKYEDLNKEQKAVYKGIADTDRATAHEIERKKCIEQLNLVGDKQREIRQAIYDTKKGIVERAKKELKTESRLDKLQPSDLMYIQTALNLDNGGDNKLFLAKKYNYNLEALELINMAGDKSVKLHHPLDAYEHPIAELPNSMVSVGQYLRFEAHEIVKPYKNRAFTGSLTEVGKKNIFDGIF